MSNEREAFVTALITDDYLPGVLALEKSLRETCSHSLFVLASRNLDVSTYASMRRCGITYDVADDISVDTEVFAKIDDIYSHWKNTLFKFRVFELIQFDKIVFIDSDIMIIEAIDDLFDWPDMSATIAGGSYPGNESWQNLCSGLFVAEPRIGIVEKLISFVPAVSKKNQNFGDQDVLMDYFSDWAQNESLHLPASYNVFFDHYHYYIKNGGVKALHFIGKEKPWMIPMWKVPLVYLRCAIKGNASAIRLLMRYRKSLKAVRWIE